jgi:hypothetical protein
MTSPEKVQPWTAGGRPRQRLIVGIGLTLVLVGAYAFAVLSFGGTMQGALQPPTPPEGGVSLVFVPERVSADNQEVDGSLVVFPHESIVDPDGRLSVDLFVTVSPALTSSTFSLSAGSVPSPLTITLPAPGTVQQYPFDTYALDEDFVVAGGRDGEGLVDLPASASVYFRVPGWAFAAEASNGDEVRGTIDRAGSTKAIAVLLLSLMVGLALIAMFAVNSATRGRMPLELSIASWLTAILFALIPIRGFFPGGPPLGSWMDILVFFWVEMILMACVGLVAWAVIARARDRSRPPAAEDGVVDKGGAGDHR